MTSRDAVAAVLRKKILSGELAPGERLTVPDIARELGVSQTPAREALQVLESDGIVRMTAYRGARVADLDPNDCEEIYLMREALERLAAKEGTRSIGKEGLAELQRRLEEMRSAAKEGDIDQFLRADRAFHKAHYLASGRVGLWERIISLRDAAERYTRLTYKTLPKEMVERTEAHARLLDHIRSQDEDACADWISRVLLRVPLKMREILNENTEPRESQSL